MLYVDIYYTHLLVISILPIFLFYFILVCSKEGRKKKSVGQSCRQRQHRRIKPLEVWEMAQIVLYRCGHIEIFVSRFCLEIQSPT